MSDIREGAGTIDPYRETLATPGATLIPAKPEGSELTLNEDGSATFDLGKDKSKEPEAGHFDNLAANMDASRLSVIATDLLDAIEVDKEARKKRDQKYEEGLRRTGLGDDAPGGAPFNGASRVVHPMLTEAVIDYAGRVAGELLPPDGPVKASIFGAPTNDKTERAERVARYMNFQITELMPSAYSELEQGFTQEALSGVFYTKMFVNDGKPDVMVVYVDQVHRPSTDGDFYSQQRITHEMLVDKWTFEENVNAGLWLDLVNTASSPASLDQSGPTRANDRIIGKDQTSENIDDERPVFEISTRLALKGPDDDVLPYLVTIDEQSKDVLAIYRNWEEKDANKSRLDFLVEWPFLPWRGGSPIGLTHMIGSLSGAASGALRALLDAALLNSMQTGVKLKGGATSGGQNIRVQPGSTGEMQGTLAMDDVRKTYMPLEFAPPNGVLLQMLGFVVDAGKGVVRTTFDEFAKMSNEMPVGTANMMLEQGLKTFGSVFGRQHRSMRRFLRQLWKINQQTIVNEEVLDKFGELVVTKEDFTGPMTVQPVSDPRIFSDTQRQAQAQLVSSRATAMPHLYKDRGRAAEIFLLREMKVPQPEQFLIDSPQPKHMNAAAENVAASMGMPIKAFMGQDHEAHIAQHAAYIQSKLFGMNPLIAVKLLPPMLAHVAETMSLWYADAMLLATNATLQQTFNDPRITLEALETVKGLEVQLDRLMAELTPDVMQHAEQVLGPAMSILAEAQDLMKKLAPPTPMDPSIVAMKDVDRQTQADQKTLELKAMDAKGKQDRDAAKLQQESQQHQDEMQQSAAKAQQDAALEQQRLAQAAEEARRKDAIAQGNVAVGNDRNAVTRETARDANATKIEITEDDNRAALEIVERKIAAGEGTGNISNGKGLSK